MPKFYYIPDSDSLLHHGIKGQKHGVRRYQNKNGTWTEEGKARRRKGMSRNQAFGSLADNTGAYLDAILEGSTGPYISTKKYNAIQGLGKAAEELAKYEYPKESKEWHDIKDKTTKGALVCGSIGAALGGVTVGALAAVSTGGLGTAAGATVGSLFGGMIGGTISDLALSSKYDYTTAEKKYREAVNKCLTTAVEDYANNYKYSESKYSKIDPDKVVKDVCKDMDEYYYPYAFDNDDIESSHRYKYGVPGQRWGIRNYPNSEGNLTQEGHEHHKTNK